MNWTNKEIEKLKLYLEDGLTHAQIAELLNEGFGTARTASAVKNKCFSLGLKSKNKVIHTTEQYKAALPDDIELLEEYVNNYTPILHRHSCGYKWKASPTNIKQGTGCPVCASNIKKTTEQYKADIPEGIELLEDYVNTHTPILHKHSCGHKWKAQPSHIKQGTSCPVCASNAKHTTEQYKADIPEGIELLEEYEGARIPILHKCLICNEEWKAQPRHIKQGTNCPVCVNKARPGYYASLTKEQADALGYPLYLYNIKLQYEDEIFYKIGLTKNEDRSRYNEYKPYMVIEEISFEKYDAWTAICKENELKLTCNYTTKHKFKGHTECYIELVCI